MSALVRRVRGSARSTRIAFLLLLGMIVQRSPAQITRGLLAVQDLGLPPGRSVAAFEVKTWGVSLLSVCRIPPSWLLSQEKFEDPAGVLRGRADVHGERLRELHDIFLVDVYDYQPLAKGNPEGEYHPASFSGWVEIADRSLGKPLSRRSLRASNFHLTPASQCPAPPAGKP